MIGPNAYRLALPPALSNVYDVFHMSQLQKYIYDLSHVIKREEIKPESDLQYEERP